MDRGGKARFRQIEPGRIGLGTPGHAADLSLVKGRFNSVPGQKQEERKELLLIL